MLSGKIFWRTLKASVSACSAWWDTDSIEIESILFGKPEHPLPQASWKMLEKKWRILSAVEFLILRKVILKLTTSYKVRF